MATPLLPSLSLRVGEVAALRLRVALEYAARVDCHYAAPGGFVRRDRVVALFWPELDHERALVRGHRRRADRFQVVLRLGGDARHGGGLHVSAETSRGLCAMRGRL
ncbi:MAG: hypothetical protein IIB36_09720 [Gemmatimonadetes bacterium]|nr:hypothetical protein [Gemmatimonadota bacterium]